MDTRFSLASLAKGFCVLATSIVVIGGVQAQGNGWKVTTVEMSDSFANSTAYATATKGHYNFGVNSNMYMYSEAKTSAGGVPQPSYFNASGSAFRKSRSTFTWIGSGSPTSMTMLSSQEWDVTPAGPNTAGPYATASFNGTSVTAASGSTPWVSGGTVATSGTQITYSAGSTSASGYSSGFSGRASVAKYLWDTTNLSSIQ
jgi:hypothetical protein